MINNFVLNVALRYFGAKKSNRLVSFISSFSLIGVMLGVAALIVVMAVMEGFHIELTSGIIGVGGDISVTKFGKVTENETGYQNRPSRIDDFVNLAQKIQEVKGIKSVIPQVQEKALAISGSESVGVLLRGMEAKDLKHKSIIVDHQLAGDISNIYNANINSGYGASIGKELAIALKLRVGDQVTIICPNNIKTLLGNLPRKKTLTVESVFSSGMYDYDSTSIIVSLETAQKLFSYGDEVNLIEVYSENPQRADYFVLDLLGKLGPDYAVSSWFNTNAQFLNALKIERVAMFTILSLIIIVAAFNIISSLFMLVNEKSKDIAILKTIGASRTQILLIFIINGSMIGVIGTALGVTLGILLANNIDNVRKFLESMSGMHIFEAAIYFLYHLPSKVVPENVVFISIMSITISVLATIYPAYKAANIDPSEALRNE